MIHEKPLPADPPASASAFPIGAAGLAVLDPSQSKTSLLSPRLRDVAKEKKNKRNTLTVMVEPFSRTIKNWKGKTQGLYRHYSRITTTTTTSTTAGAAPSPAQAHRQTTYLRQGCTLVE